MLKRNDPPEPTQLPAERPKADHTLPGAPKPDNALPETRPKPKTDPTPPPTLEAYPDTGNGLQIVTLIGLLEEPAQYQVGKPIPQDIAIGRDIFNLSDRAAGVYNFRVR